MKVLIKDVQLQVRIGRTTGSSIHTNIGVPQGDCLSPVLFTLYLAAALKASIPNQDHTYTKPAEPTADLLPRHLQDHTYATTRDIICRHKSTIKSWATNAEHKIEKIKKTIPSQLKNYNLHINESKTEEYKIGRDGPEDWKKCKYLGTLLYTGSDIIRRKGLAISAFNKLNHIFKNKKLSTRLKVRVFNAYVASIFLYNSELWTMTRALEHKLNTFQRSLLRKLLNIRWPQTISNRNLYEQTNEILWSKKIKSRRLSYSTT